MIGLLVMSHGDFSKGLLDAVEMVAGKQEKIITIGLYPGEGPDEYEENISKSIEELDDGSGVIGFVDFLGGTPSTSAMKVCAKRDFPCFTGVNMPMLVEAILAREAEGADLDQVVQVCADAGPEGIMRLDEIIKETVSDDEDE